MERVVYFLGAGFSAPLGIPIMRDFLIKSKDLYFKDPIKYEHFKRIFTKIDKMHIAKTYYETDLLNIEEILSILEMQRHTGGNVKSKEFCKYIADVITNYTPAFPKKDSPYSNNFWLEIFCNHTEYGFFLCSIFNLEMRLIQGSDGGQIINFERIGCLDKCYSVITVNYDMVLENIAKLIRENYYGKAEHINFVSTINADEELNKEKVYLAKLHGTIDPLEIVPPTWNKHSNRNLQEVWVMAHKLLREANHIRILGYSLQDSDSYVRYLFKSSVLESEHLKTIDVICLDKTETREIKNRYDEFIKFKNYRFVNGDIKKYLEGIKRHFMYSDGIDLTAALYGKK